MAGEDVGRESATWTLSADRKTLTVVAKGTDSAGVAYVSTQVYEEPVGDRDGCCSASRADRVRRPSIVGTPAYARVVSRAMESSITRTD
jgi:hypothetical protein